MNKNEEAVAAVLLKYQDALNQADAEAVMKLYAPDGVFMPQNFPSSAGTDVVRKAYDAVFRAITLKVIFDVAEVHQVASDCSADVATARKAQRIFGIRCCRHRVPIILSEQRVPGSYRRYDRGHRSRDGR